MGQDWTRLSDDKKKCHKFKKKLLLKMFVGTIANIISCERVCFFVYVLCRVCVLVCMGGSVVTCTMQQEGVDQSNYLTKKRKLGGI